MCVNIKIISFSFRLSQNKFNSCMQIYFCFNLLTHKIFHLCVCIHMACSWSSCVRLCTLIKKKKMNMRWNKRITVRKKWSHYTRHILCCYRARTPFWLQFFKSDRFFFISHTTFLWLHDHCCCAGREKKCLLFTCSVCLSVAFVFICVFVCGAIFIKTWSRFVVVVFVV